MAAKLALASCLSPAASCDAGNISQRTGKRTSCAVLRSCGAGYGSATRRFFSAWVDAWSQSALSCGQCRLARIFTQFEYCRWHTVERDRLWLLWVLR